MRWGRSHRRCPPAGGHRSAPAAGAGAVRRFARAAAVVAAAWLALAPARARAETLELTVEDAVTRALTTGEETRLSAIQTREAKGQVREAFSAALPQITGAVRYTRQIASIFEPFAAETDIASIFSNSPFGAENTWIAELKASQKLFSGGKVGAGIRAARAVGKGAAAQERETALEVTFAVRRAYYDAAYAGRLVEIAEGTLDQARRHLRDVEAQHREGMTAEYDLLRAQVDAANQEPPAVAARNNYTLALLELKRLINVPLEQELKLTTPLGFPGDSVPVLAEGPPTGQARPALRVADAEVDARNQFLRVERGYRWPDLTASTTLQQEAFRRNGWPVREDFRRNWEATVALEFPIFLGLRTEGQIQQAKAQYERAVVDRQRLRESVTIEVAGARDELRRATRLLAARRETVRQARRARDIAEVRFSNGLATQLEVSDARLQYQVAEVNEAQATHDYLIALAGLERAVGRPLALEHKPLDQVTSPDDGKGNER